MYPLRHLMQTFAVMIVMIIALAMPSGAYAHAGHAHSAQTVVQVTVAHPPSDVTAPVVADAGRAAREVTLPADTTSHRSGPVRCNGHCCGATVCFCAPAVIPDGVVIRGLLGDPNLIAWRNTPPAPSFIPEALPKPPRTFA